ncbi:MAG: DUF192 domain-containing protein [Dehalococcoidia bacterium]
MRLASTMFLALILLLAACGSSSDDAPRTAVAGGPTIEVTATEAGASPSASPTIEASSGEPVASTASTPVEELGVVEFVDGDAVLGSLPLEVPPREEYGIGLSGRARLGERGMLFDYLEPNHEGPFWMKNTHVDLDIAFVGGDGRIVSIRQMEAESLDLVYSEAPYQWAIEAPFGWYEDRGIVVGTEVHFLFDTPSALAAS